MIQSMMLDVTSINYAIHFWEAGNLAMACNRRARWKDDESLDRLLPCVHENTSAVLNRGSCIETQRHH